MAGINQTTRPGQYLILQSGPVPAVLSLQGITTATQGETASASYALAFRLTGYGQAWPSQWRPLAELAAASALFAGRMQHVQVRFTHTGDPATLQVDSFTLTGTAVPPQAPTGLLASHYLAKDLYGTHAHEHLALALLAKLYRPGLLPTFLSRGQGEDPAPELDDQAFLDLWLTSCRFYALVILHARRLGELPTDPELLSAYLEQRGIHLRPGGYQAADLGELRALLLDQAGAGRARGTLGVFSDQGEFSRLVGRPALGPVQPAQRAALARVDQVGWVLGQTSPSYAGTQSLPSAWARYQDTPLAKALLRLLPLPYGTGSVAFDDGTLANALGGPYVVPRPALALKPTNELAAQLGGQGLLAPVKGRPQFASALAIDPAVDYEILWLVRQPDPRATTRLTLHLFNGYGYPVPGYDHPTLGAPTTQVVAGPFPSRWTWVRTILWNYRQAPGTTAAESWTNLGRGSQLRQSPGAMLAQPGAWAERNSPGQPGALLVADIIVRPLVHGTSLHPQAPRAGTPPSDRPLRYDVASGPRPPAFLGSGPQLHAWYRNLNPALTEDAIDTITRAELSPADAHLVLYPAP